METVKKHKIMIVGFLAAGILGIVALIAFASSEKSVVESAVTEQSTCNREAKACPTVCPKPCCKAENGVKACETNCEKVCCTAKIAEDNVKTCPLNTPKSCCGKN